MNARCSTLSAPPSLLRTLLRLGLILLASMAMAPAAMAATAGGADFDHVGTGFALTGAHRDAKCESCHLNGVFKGTPKDCGSCHGRGSRFQTTQLPQQHVSVNGAGCDACHRSNAWTPAKFSHAEVASGSCASCHNGVTAIGKDSGHVATTASCDTCHRTGAWSPALFDHRNVSAGTCNSCHNGTQASGKPNNHVLTSQHFYI